MTTLWCPECGTEYEAGVAACADDGASLVERRPATDDDTGDGGDREVVVYELEEWTDEQRSRLEMRLVAEGIEHQWEAPTGADVRAGYDPGQDSVVDTDLVVGTHDEARVDQLLDEVEFPESLEAAPSGDADGVDDEANYEVMSHLYVAADRLKDSPGDLALAGDLFDTADAARAADPPFGVDGDVWRAVQDLAGTVASLLEQDADDDVVQERAQELRDLLFPFV